MYSLGNNCWHKFSLDTLVIANIERLDAQGIGALLDKMEDNDHMDNIEV